MYENEENDPLNKASYAISLTGLILYILEAIIKIIATGLYSHKRSFLKIGWHWFDLYIIVFGILSAIPSLRKNDVILILDLLRNLKFTYAITPMRKLMEPFLLSLVKMVDVFSMLLFILLLYSIACVSAFKGNVYMRCRKTPAPVNGTWEIDTAIGRLCNAYGLGDYDCPAGTYCGSPDMYDITLTEEDIYGTPMTWYGAIGFDDVFRAFIANYQLITLEDWATLMYRMQDSNGTGFSQVFFLTLIFIGNYFLINLIVAVIVNTFTAYRSTQSSDSEEQNNPAIEPPPIKIEECPHNAESAIALKTPLDISPSSNEQKALQKDDTCRPALTKPTQNTEPESCLQSFCQEILKSTIFFWIIIAYIMMNLILLALDREKTSDREKEIVDGLDIMIFVVFVIESFVSIGAFGFQEYVLSKQGIIDIVTNLMGIIEVSLTYSKYSNGTFQKFNI